MKEANPEFYFDHSVVCGGGDGGGGGGNIDNSVSFMS